MTTVFIWNNNQVTHQIAKRIGYSPKAKDVIGHCCMNIHDDFVSLIEKELQTSIDNTDAHVSWWPEGGSNKTQRTGTGMTSPNLLIDIMWEGYVPDHIIRIESPHWAHVQRMETEWNRQKQREGVSGSYHFVTENCSRIVSRVLRRGFNMKRGNIRFGNLASGVWTPLMVKRLALSLKGGMRSDIPARQMHWHTFVDELVEKRVIFPQTGSLMKLLKRRASNRGSSGADARFDFSEASRALDRFRKSRLENFMKEKNFPVSLLAYSEARGRLRTHQESVQAVLFWMGEELSQREIDQYTNSGKLDTLIQLADTIPAPPPKRPPRKNRKPRPRVSPQEK